MHGLINAFGDQVTAALSLEQGALPKPELLVRIEVRDAPRVAALLQRLTAMVADETGLEWKQRKVDENVVHFVNVDVEQRFKLSPCWALADGALLLGSDAAVLVRALRLDDPEDSLAAQEDFRTLATNTQGAFGVLHLRLFRGVDLAWRTVETMVFPQVDAHADDIGFDSSALPDSEAMGALLDTSTVAAFADESGYSLESRGALGSGAWLAAIGVIPQAPLESVEVARIEGAMQRMRALRDAASWDKETIVAAFQEALPTFRHLERHKSLDDKM